MLIVDTSVLLAAADNADPDRRHPVVAVAPRGHLVLGTAVPEASVDEDRNPSLHEDDVGMHLHATGSDQQILPEAEPAAKGDGSSSEAAAVGSARVLVTPPGSQPKGTADVRHRRPRGHDHELRPAESDFQMRGYIEQMDCFGRLVHSRAPYDVHHQVTIRANRDTLYSFGVFDLTTPLTVHLPEPDGRYQSLMAVSQDHSTEPHYSPAAVTLTTERVGTRYVTLVVRTFADPTDPDDLARAHALQDQITTEQGDVGVFEVPSWEQGEVEHMRATLSTLAALATDSTKAFGRKEDLDPVYWALGAAIGGGGLTAAAARYESAHPDHNDGETPYTLTVGDVPCDASGR